VPGLLRRAWRAVAAVAGAVRTGRRRRAARARRPAPTLAARGSAALRLLGSTRLPWIGALPFTGLPMWQPVHRIGLVCLVSRRRRAPLRLRLTPEAVLHFASMSPAVWAGGFTLPTAETWRELYTPSRQRLIADVQRNDRQRPLQPLRRRWHRQVVRLVTALADRPASKRPVPATRRGWPPALASPLPG
jgi:hypothetical protein